MTTQQQDNLKFDASAWELKCQSLQKDCVSRSGCNYELFVESFSKTIDRELWSIADPDRQAAIKIAEQYDYACPEEIEELAKYSAENGYCIHHFDPDCCPLGCGSL